MVETRKSKKKNKFESLETLEEKLNNFNKEINALRSKKEQLSLIFKEKENEIDENLENLEIKLEKKSVLVIKAKGILQSSKNDFQKIIIKEMTFERYFAKINKELIEKNEKEADFAEKKRKFISNFS